MPGPRTLAGTLAQAFAAGRISADDLLDRGRSVVGKKRWLKGLVQRVIARFGEPFRLRARPVEEFLRADRLFLRACDRWDEDDEPLGFAPSPKFEPPAALANLPLPQSASEPELADWLGVTPQELAWFSDPRHLLRVGPAEPLRHYRYHWLRKRGGAARLIESPKPRLKAIQRRILHELLDHVPTHPAVHGFRKGRNIVSCAAPHAGRSVVLRMDLRDFFPSIVAARVLGIFLTLGYPEPVARCLTGLCTTWTPPQVFADYPLRDAVLPRLEMESLYRKPHLPQGAPTSPTLANLCAFRLDVRLTGLARAAEATYTRYADDLIFSGDVPLARAAKRFVVQAGAIALDENFAVNFRKTRIMRQGVRQRVTGLVVNESPSVPRDEYDRLKAILHNCATHGPISQNHAQRADFRESLLGRMAFVKQVNPARGTKLQRLWERIEWALPAAAEGSSLDASPTAVEPASKVL
jgi:hypothetical protein